MISSLSGLLATADGQLRYKSELLANGGQDDGTLGHVYSNYGTIRVRFFLPDGFWA